MIDVEQARDLIDRTLRKLGHKYAKPEAVELVLCTGIVESRYKYIRQLGSGPARSFWQVEPDTAIDNCTSFLKFRSGLLDRCVVATHIPRRYWVKPTKAEWDILLETNLTAGIVHCRLKYWRVPKPLAKTTAGMADFWKTWYNTEKGSGEIHDFIESVRKYL